MKGANRKTGVKSRRPREPADKLTKLYETDETAWLEQTAQLIEQGRYSDLDCRHLREYLEEWAQRDRREVMSRLTSFLTELLLKEQESWKQTGGWRSHMRLERHELESLLESPTLRRYAIAVLSKAYGEAVRTATDELAVDPGSFPGKCPYSVDDLLRFEWGPQP